ncbi:hypothetical protein DL766_004536 [Monosporascus sp. MC13-8B]|uniref:C2H2-type domain-containing protein n=1 Tax=Monosporascus cannonballus TaxID=155416 RepID=A0ABY0HIE3_9PEZI|nr:hypothetical protein DL763_005724 [Monosporascus cannonballus]RYO94154.1 hypothetical protein DL762_000664 [Monosporascus cannonballus]RYP31106.1 hypothetical protein DL766_004536 [Monosporascus sp. MC13-8B]
MSKSLTPATRVQPPRAKKRIFDTPDQTGPEQKHGNTDIMPATGQRQLAKLEGRQSRLRLNLSRDKFLARLEMAISRTSDALVTNKKLEKSRKSRQALESDSSVAKPVGEGVAHHKCPFEPWRSINCRYCDFNSRSPKNTAPVAPMHLIRHDDFGPEQRGEFGGIQFVVDICGAQEKVILLRMIGLDGPADGFDGHSGDNSRSKKRKEPEGESGRNPIEDTTPHGKRLKKNPPATTQEGVDELLASRKRGNLSNSPDNGNMVEQEPTETLVSGAAPARHVGKRSSRPRIHESEEDIMITRRTHKKAQVPAAAESLPTQKQLMKEPLANTTPKRKRRKLSPPPATDGTNDIDDGDDEDVIIRRKRSRIRV